MTGSTFVIRFDSPSVPFVRIPGLRISGNERVPRLFVLGSEYYHGEERRYLSSHALHVNPGTSNEVVIGTDLYRRLTRGVRAGMIVFKSHARKVEQPQPLDQFCWIDELPKDSPRSILVAELSTLMAALPSRNEIRWPELYAAVDWRAFPTGMHNRPSRILNQITPPDLSAMTEEQKASARQDVLHVLGAAADMEGGTTWRLWASLKRHEGQLLVPCECVMVPRGASLFASMPENFQRTQVIARDHCMDLRALQGKDGKLRWDLYHILSAGHRPGS